MADEDNFDIDIYGDGGGGEEYDDGGAHTEENTFTQSHDSSANHQIANEENDGSNNVAQAQNFQSAHEEQHPQMDEPASHAEPQSTQSLPTQGTKRKEAQDERPLDPGATAALFISDLPWWITDDDIRGCTSQGGCEDELEEVTFSEHKVNGKSKGQAYVLFSTPQAATATKRCMETATNGKPKFACNYTNPMMNPFKTLPKDGNMRNTSQGPRAPSSGFSAGGQTQPGTNQGAFRGGRGGYNNNRGGMGGYNRGGFNQTMGGNFAAGGMNNFQTGMGGMNQYGGFQNRGGMMGGMRGGNVGMRGGRGGMNNMMGMPMGGMMGGMPGQMPNMGMGMPNMGMQGAGFQNTNFFPQQNDNWNPHGAKRTRQE